MGLCLMCPEGKARRPSHGLVCDPCRGRLRQQLAEVPELLAELNVRELVTDERVVADPVARLLPAASIPSRKRQRVSGTSERSTPVNVTAVDLSLRARSDSVHDPFGDQIGELSVATILRAWVSDIGDHYAVTQWPRLAVLPMATWLTVRLDQICDDFDAVGEFAAEIRRTRSVLRGQLGIVAYDDELKQGVQCPKCNIRAALHQANGSIHIECSSCGCLLTVEEYNAWAKLLAADVEWLRKAICSRCEQRRLYIIKSAEEPRPVWCGWCDDIKGREV